MSSSTQHAVALELGFPDSLIRQALRLRKFKNAGELVDYLDSREEEFSAAAAKHEDEVRDAAAAAGKTEDLTGGEVVEKELSLREETELLYRLSVCLSCRVQARRIVLLPCGHFALCTACAKLKKNCPVRGCNVKIMETILTF